MRSITGGMTSARIDWSIAKRMPARRNNSGSGRLPPSQRLAVARHRPVVVELLLAPHLERAELRDAVFDEVERMPEQMRDALLA